MKMMFTEEEITVMNPEEGTSSGSKDFDGFICSLEERTST